MRIVILGAGNVGTNLHYALAKKGIRAELISSYYTHDGWQTADGELPSADAYIYAVADQALEEVASHVSAPKALHLHTSGTMPLDVFGEDKPHAGVMYFFQSFSKAHLIEDWSGIPCIIEGKDIDSLAAIYSLAQCLTSRIYEANQPAREKLHIAGVFANNFSNLMYRLAAEVLKDTNIPFEVLLPLIDQTAAKVHVISPKEAQTGPAQRNDVTVALHHGQVLRQREDGEFLASDLEIVYLMLNKLINESARNVPNRESLVETAMRGLSRAAEEERNR